MSMEPEPRVLFNNKDLGKLEVVYTEPMLAIDGTAEGREPWNGRTVYRQRLPSLDW